MSILEYNEITPRKFIILDGDPYEVVDAHIFRMQQRKPQNKTKLRNLISGRVVEQTFHQSEKAEEADLEKRNIKYLYNNRGEWWFSDIDNPANRFKIEENFIGSAGKFLKSNTEVEALIFDEKIIGVKPPVKVVLKIKSAPPSIKGNTAQGGNKVVVLETGAEINAPLFLNEGDIIVVNTETGEYVERAK
jgi:elongation factor P